ncbi:hypothetical protein [uncultured Treponema sp.]|uniref:hypothetical protein n=1 Tax=uncultured Treponema sp. TaxID=162155 RepID=UPI0025E9579C|nr:hypothetical protein [uncultured Treponema sp.]
MEQELFSKDDLMQREEFMQDQMRRKGYDIQDHFNQTDHVIDLFGEIEKAYTNRTEQNNCSSVFDGMSSDDVIIAFFPCIYFETIQMTYYQLTSLNNRHKPKTEQIIDAIERLEKRTLFHTLLYKLVFIAEHDRLRLVIENPATKPSYLIGMQNFPNPTFIDKNRMERGDYFVKPTAYWFVNFEPTHGFTRQNDKEQKIINKCKQGIKAGICSEERSLISPDYARNFICDFIIGKKQENQREPELF